MKLRRVKMPDNTGRYWHCHLKKDCKLAGGHCIQHKPSDHSMRDFPIHIRRDWGYLQIERICPCGVGHPDPDALAYDIEVLGHDESDAIHGCCIVCHK